MLKNRFSLAEFGIFLPILQMLNIFFKCTQISFRAALAVPAIFLLQTKQYWVAYGQGISPAILLQYLHKLNGIVPFNPTEQQRFGHPNLILSRRRFLKEQPIQGSTIIISHNFWYVNSHDMERLTQRVKVTGLLLDNASDRLKKLGTSL